ncbi:hypothetical protein [Amycolatopsis mediterranei]|uniref:Uncharacterized protein n=1 Tax=Amycolatopsis mediterranei (strain S699) TaxID=713604 RepID=A0A9R0P4N6_AMYMS|nr:hypothetical protein [Amycolatopsis mediterranei]AEK46317.1 hypothetical protein RAM_39250 [Amycolatopsis mediterranei S699]
MRHGRTTHGLFRQNKARSPSFFSAAGSTGRNAAEFGRKPERSIS